MPVCHYSNLTMLRALLLSLTLIAGLAQAATTRQQPVSLTTDQGTLHGSLLLPQSDKPLPVALLIAGSGPTDRNGNNPEGGHNDALKKLAQVLARNGIASLRYDKRGVAASRSATPDERDLSVERYVADASGWLRQLKDDPRFDRVILIGHSEGALIASLAATDSPADALVSIAGPAYPIGQVLDMQLAMRLPPALLAESRHILANLIRGTLQPEVPEALQVVYRPSVQPYLISLLRQDPAENFAALRIPALIVQGSHDAQVSPDNAELLKQAKPDAELAMIAGMNHVMRITPAAWQEQLASYDDPQLPLARALGERIVAFIRSSAEKNGR
ncbi:Alpha/beta hydrolase family protein [Pseudomonas sp. THAF187a]|uniref:alpha/beta hydrolase family protein n=1 Tax=unclassified Pseudomonas TaxID=196821 RepID=UPI0012697593|nr:MULTISPECIES: alpha/beta fold hydrolase [unclassified Pseudomonas]QFT22846.1 Alpha/beta hydrolase family protein [Pseudomonas sp. THAF187a]QFT43033.1 Alpha/beta hydrolase family protein [Pseudomonas sp. THAF42]